MIKYFTYCLLAFSTSWSCWMDPSIDKEKYPDAWKAYLYATEQANNATEWGRLEDIGVTPTFYSAFRSIDFAIDHSSNVLKQHAYHTRSEFWYLADPILPFNYKYVLRDLIAACNLHDSNDHVLESQDFFLSNDTNYEWLLDLSNVLFKMKKNKKSLFAAFLCFKRILLYGYKTPLTQQQLASHALNACFLIAKNYCELSKKYEDSYEYDDYVNGEIYALEQFLNLGFGHFEEFLNPFEGVYLYFADLEYKADDLQEDATNIFYFLGTKELEELSKVKCGYENKNLALQVLKRRARMSLIRHETNDAIKYYKLALQYFPDHGETYAHLGNVYFIIKDYSQAHFYFSKAIEYNYTKPSILKLHQLSEQLKHNES